MLFDDPASLEPEAVLKWLEVCSDALNSFAEEAYELMRTDREPPAVLIEALGLGASQADVRDYFLACKQELDLSALLALTAAAEARIRLDAALRMERREDALGKRLALLRSSAPMEWAVPLYDGGILEEWKRYIGSLTEIVEHDRVRLRSAIGRFKNLLLVRHWVAHGRYWELQWGVEKFSPAAAVEIVSALYLALRRAAECRDLMAFAWRP